MKTNLGWIKIEAIRKMLLPSVIPAPPFVIPAEAGIQKGIKSFANLDSRFLGNDNQNIPCHLRRWIIPALLLFPVVILLAADTLNDTLQKGLLEEEANHNLEAAIQAYQSVTAQSDEQRKVAATAIFRLGECYRKLGKTPEAATYYERILRDFADQEPLVKLSRENLSAMGVSVKASDPSGETAVTTSAEAQELEKIKTIVKNSPDLINAKSENGRTLLHKAAEAGQVMVAEFLLANGADVNIEDTSSDTPLILATSNGHKAMVELLLKHGAKIDGTRRTPLHAAASGGYAMLVELLLKNGAKVNVINGSGLTPLHLAVMGAHKAIVEILAANKADINAKASPEQPFTIVGTNNQRINISQGITPLHFAIKMNYPEIVEFLLANGANVNTATENGWTPLHIAADSILKKMVETLLKHKADVNAKTKDGLTPLHLAVSGNQPDMVELLLASGAEVEAKDSKGKTPLLLAMEKNNQAVTKVLLKYKADMNTKTENGSTLLHLAVSGNQLDIVELLLASGAEVDAKDSEGKTPLLWVQCNKNAQAITELLLKNKADINATDKDGVTLLAQVFLKNMGISSISSDEENFERFAEYLLDQGANPNIQFKCRSYYNTVGAPLHIAKHLGNTRWIEFLLAHQVDLNLKDPDGNTPLYWATIQRGPNKDIIKTTQYLLTHHPDVNIKNAKNQTVYDLVQAKGTMSRLRPSSIALSGNDQKILALLREHGATETKRLEEKDSKYFEVPGLQGGEVYFFGAVRSNSLKLEEGKKTTLFDALIKVGLADSADLTSLRFSRVDPETKETFTETVNASGITKGARSQVVILWNGDRIEVPMKAIQTSK